MAGPAIASPGLGDIKEIPVKIEKWIKQQGPGAEVAFAGFASAFQGGAIGYLLGSMTQTDSAALQNPNMNPQMAAQLKAMSTGGPWTQARNIAVLSGVNAALSLAIKKARKGKEDVWGAMGASFGSGVAFGLVSGGPNPFQTAFTTGCVFAAFNGVFYQLGHMFNPPQDDTNYWQAKHLLKTLGLTKYEQNIRKGMLTDNTILLWNDAALQEVRIPPGPRLMILHHVEQYRNPSNVLKLALPVPPPSAMAAGH